MRRTIAITVASAALAAITFLGYSRLTPHAASGTADVWYHASDVALLASTGRPQLVEFFHPT